MNKLPARTGALTLFAAGVMLSASAHAQFNGGLKCTMQFTMKGWSAFYKTSSGQGTVTCGNGTSMRVALSSKGGGLTLGKSSIDNGYGEFTGVSNIREILGDYATGSAHSTAAQSGGSVSALTKGEVSLALKGTGRGWDAGIDFGKFTITEIPGAPESPPVTTEAPAAPAPAPPGQ